MFISTSHMKNKKEEEKNNQEAINESEDDKIRKQKSNKPVETKEKKLTDIRETDSLLRSSDKDEETIKRRIKKKG